MAELRRWPNCGKKRFVAFPQFGQSVGAVREGSPLRWCGCWWEGGQRRQSSGRWRPRSLTWPLDLGPPRLAGMERAELAASPEPACCVQVTTLTKTARPVLPMYFDCRGGGLG